MMMKTLLASALLTGIAVSAQDLTSSQLTFGDGLIETLYNNDENQCSSALGVSMMMSLLYPAMSAEARTEAQTVFGYPDDDDELVWADITTQINTLYSGPDDTCPACPLVSIANSVWVQQGGAAVDSDYASVLGNDILYEIDFRSETAGTMVNQWVDDATNGVIDSIVDDGALPSSVVLIALNAIYLKAAWRNSFETFRTSQDTFYGPDKIAVERSDAIFMHQVDYFPYSSTVVPGHQIIQLSFEPADSTLSMILAVPIVRNAAMTDAATVISSLPELQRTRVALGMPKFEYETLYQDNLKAAMLTAGVQLPFAGGHLCIFENDCSPALDIVLQKTFISVDEEGVEAAAVTGGIVSTSVPTENPVEVMADLPFQFYIYDSATSTVLFEGRVIDPTPQDATFELTAKHTDDDFWSANFPITAATRVFDDSPVSMPVPTPVQAPMESPATPTTMAQPTPATPTISVESSSSSTAETLFTSLALSFGLLLAF